MDGALDLFVSANIEASANWAWIIFKVHRFASQTSINSRVACHEMMIADSSTPAS